MGIMRRRMRRRAVVGGAVVGSAVAANKNKAAAEQAQQQKSVEAAPEQPAAEAPQTMDEKLATVAKLAELHKSGALTDEEFTQQKAQILGS